MYKIVKKLKEKLQEKLSQKGQGMVEYAIIIAVVAIIAVFVLGTTDDDASKGTLAGAVKGAFSTASQKIKDASTGTTESPAGGGTTEGGTTGT